MTEFKYFDKIFKSKQNKSSAEHLELFKKTYADFANDTPIDIIKFAKKLGIKIYADSSFDDSVSGKIVCDTEYDENRYSIYINDNHPPKRKIFTIAHEIGHFVCDSDYLKENQKIIDDETCKNFLCRSENGTKGEEENNREVRANKFAAELLMPTETFKKMWCENPNFKKLSEELDVSVEAVKIRASNLFGVIF